MDDQNKNLILATVLSLAVLIVWFVVFPPPTPPVQDPVALEQAQIAAPAADGSIAGAMTQAPAVADAPRIPIETPSLSGSISLLGGRIDDLALLRYRETLDPDSPTVTLLSPLGEDIAYYALFGWAPGLGLEPDQVPGTDTLWQVEQGTALTPDSPLTLRWDSPAGLVFRRTISVDENYMFTVAQSVENPTDRAYRAAPYGIVARHGLPKMQNFFILHEGVVGMANDTLIEEDYDALTELDPNPAFGNARTDIREGVTGGWIGFTDKNWMTTLIPAAGDPVRQIALYQDAAGIYQTQVVHGGQDLLPGQSVTQTTRLFAGAKEWDVIRAYQNQGGIAKFIDSIDWGWFFFLTKPIFFVLHWLNLMIGNMGLSIIALTFLLKALLLPLAFKSYVSMARMKELQPEMEKLKERTAGDTQKMQKEMMELYKREKVNPAAGCLPILLQIPIFFSLYKVIFVTIELRHAPFFGPFRDLSAPDPTSLMNAFGLLPWAAPEPGSILALVFIGILPLLLGISMWLQQKLNPAPTDPTQAMIFAWMPWVFMFMLGGFASGLVIYWITNNTLTFMQQYLIMRSQGYKPDLYGNIRKSAKSPKDGAK